MKTVGTNAPANTLPPQMQPFGGQLDQQMMQLLFQHIMQTMMQNGAQGGLPQMAQQGANAPAGNGACGAGCNPLTNPQRQQLGQAMQGFNQDLKGLLRNLMQNGFGPQAGPRPQLPARRAPIGNPAGAGPVAKGPIFNAPVGGNAAPVIGGNAAPAAKGPIFNAPVGGNAAPVIGGNAAPVIGGNAAPLNDAAKNVKWGGVHGKGAYTWDGNKVNFAKGTYAGGQGVWDKDAKKVRIFDKTGKHVANQAVSKMAGGKPKVASPLVFDLNGDGVKTTGVSKKFDITGKGATKTAWAAGGDGVLAFNGKLDKDGKAGSTGKELFGNNTQFVGKDGKVQGGFQNGFDALRAFAADKLGVNGAELKSLNAQQIKQLEAQGLVMKTNGKDAKPSELGITNINLGFTNSDKVDGNGNEHRQQGAFDINGKKAQVADVWFRYQ